MKLLFIIKFINFFFHITKLLIIESTETLEIKTSVLFNLDFANNTILSCFFFLLIDLYFLIPAFITQIFNLIAELVISIGISIKEGKVEMKMHPVTVEIKISKCSV